MFEGFSRGSGLSEPSREGLEEGGLLLLLWRSPAAVLTVGQLPHFEGPQFDLVDDGGVVGDSDIMRILGGDSMENFTSEYAWDLVLTF